MSENDRKFKAEFTLGKVKSWKMSQKKSENFRYKHAYIVPRAMIGWENIYESAFSIGPLVWPYYFIVPVRVFGP